MHDMTAHFGLANADVPNRMSQVPVCTPNATVDDVATEVADRQTDRQKYENVTTTTTFSVATIVLSRTLCLKQSQE